MDPEIWWDEFQSICEELTGGGDIEVIAVGVSGMGPCAVVTDHAGVPTRAAILYGVDTRATAQIARLNEELGPDEILARTANVLSSQSVGPKLMWILDNEPEALDHAERLFMPSSWIGFRLTGEYAMDYHSASQCTPLYDSRADTWDVEWATRIAPWLHLPELKWSGEVLGTTRTAIAGVKPGTPVLMGTIDAWAESVSVGADRPGRLMLMYGTTMFMIASTNRRLASERLWATRGVDPNSSSVAGGLATAGSLTAWSRELLRRARLHRCDRCCRTERPGCARTPAAPILRR